MSGYYALLTRETVITIVLTFVGAVVLWDLARRFRGRSGPLANRASKARRMARARYAVIAHQDDPELYQHVLAYLHEIDPSGQHPSLSRWRQVGLGLQGIEVAFDSEGLDWYLAHASAQEFDQMAAALQAVNLAPMVPLVREAQGWLGWHDDTRAAHGGNPEHTVYKAHLARLSGLQRRFDGLGGVDLVRSRGLDHFQKETPAILELVR